VRILQGEQSEFEIIIINDTNIDGSVEIIKDLESKYGNVKGLFSNERRGKTKAIKDGFEKSEGDVIILMDADLQYMPEDIPRLLKVLKNADVVNGLRIDRKDSLKRKIESKIYNLLIRLFFNVRFQDCNSGLKVFKREVLEDVVPLLKPRWHRFLLVLAEKRGYKVVEKPVRHRKRVVGRSKFNSPLKLFEGLFDLLSVRLFISTMGRKVLS
jgi:glycosyltransferase involved in cell wall biosynthesis